ncbi:hypothetical protein CBM2586_B10099 [Cupriavidus phytorum]|uniref:Uncharacterized protein n=1 Tax=Cupriavidus taiwanensis TaxID=164546 RepID=A0A375C914_9BURK|nr:hypothetical protein CBM2586_B10099 [Cupriavidus taiwanensis]
MSRSRRSAGIHIPARPPSPGLRGEYGGVHIESGPVHYFVDAPALAPALCITGIFNTRCVFPFPLARE